MKMYTVKEVAKLSRTTVRTLHHYHDLDLLVPAHIGENGYRYYGRDELHRLQQILFYREFGVPLKDIGAFLDKPGFDHVAALQEHRTRLEAKARRYRQLINTIDRTIADIEGKQTMDVSELYKGFSQQKQAEHEELLVSTYGEPMRKSIEVSKKAMAGRTEAEQKEKMAELQLIEFGLAEHMQEGTAPDSDLLDDLLSQHRAWVAQMWGQECSADAYAGLAEMYLAHDDFKKRYDTIAPGFAEYLPSAMKAYVGRL